MSLGGADGGISIPRRQPLSPVFRRAWEASPLCQDRPSPRLFKARDRNGPGRLPSAWPTILRPRWRLDANGFECAFVFRHLFACCDGIHRRPTTWISASRYPRSLTNALRRPRSLGGEDAPHRLLQPASDTCTCVKSRDSRGGLHLRGCHVRWSEPQQTARVMVRLTTRHELRPMRTAPSRMREDGHPRILAGSRSGEPSKGALRSAALCSADEA